jgi:hypothetical protein
MENKPQWNESTGELVRTVAVSQTNIVVIITSFLVLSSVSNLDVKAFVWLVQICFWLFVIRLSTNGKNLKCPTDHLITPIMSSFLIAYTLGYLAAPMAVYNDWNVFVILAFVFLFALDFAVGVDKCGDLKWWFLAITGFGGLIFGIVFFFILKAVGMEKFLYYTSGSNSMYCSKPSEQEFKCNVYKNGQIISSL